MYLFQKGSLRESGARDGTGEGKSAGSLAAAGHTEEGVQAMVTAAVLRLCRKRTGREGRAASAESIVVGVVQKQLVAHLRALFQSPSILCAIAPLCTNRSAP